MNFLGTKVLVLDGYGRQIATIVQQLHDIGCIITTLNTSRLDIGYTSHYPKRKLLHPETRHDMTALKGVLDREITSGKYDVVFPMLEPSTEVCLQNEELYRKYVKIIAAPKKAFEKAYDKQETMLACMDNGIPCPITKRDDESFEEYISRVGYPIAVKPRKGTGSIGFHCVRNTEEFKQLLCSGLDVKKSIIQQYISQADTQYVGFYMLDKEQNMKLGIVCNKHRWYPIDGGASCYLKTVNRPDVVEYGYRLLKAIGWQGEAFIDFIADPNDNGLVKVMEINGRIPGSIKMVWVVGAQLMKQELEYAYDLPVEAFDKEVPEGIGLRYFQTDFLWLLKSPNRFRTKPSWFDFRKSKDYIWSWRDPIPFFSYTLSHIFSYKEDMKKRGR